MTLCLPRFFHGSESLIFNIPSTDLQCKIIAINIILFTLFTPCAYFSARNICNPDYNKPGACSNNDRNFPYNNYAIHRVGAFKMIFEHCLLWDVHPNIDDFNTCIPRHVLEQNNLCFGTK